MITMEKDIEKFLNVTDSIETKRTIAKILVEIKRYREKIKSYIDTNYVDFMPNLLANELFIEEGENLIKEVENLLQNISNETLATLNDANEDLQQYIDDLQEASIGLRVSMKLLKIDDLFQCLEDVKSKNEFLSVMDIITQLKILVDPSDKILSRLECFQTIDIKLRMETETMRANLKKCFERLVQLSEKQFQNTKVVTLKISKDVKLLEDTVMALFNARFNPGQFCKFLLENYFEPIITKPSLLEFNDKSNPDFMQLTLSYSIKDLGNRPNYKDVFDKIRMIISFLSFINLKLADNYVSTILGEQLKDKLLKLIVNECLIHAIPETMDDMKNSTLVEEVTDLHQTLVDSHLINENCDRKLIEFTDKFGILFKNRFSRNIIDSAIAIMHKDLHDMTLIAEKNTAEDVVSNPFKFPCCMISKSSLDLINLMEKILRQSANDPDDKIANELVDTISLIINAYLSEVPKHHQKLLTSIPQQSALFYNNCMFLAHWVTKNSDKNIPTFSTLVKSLQSLGTQHFNEQVKTQRTTLLDILKQMDLSNAISKLGLNVHKLIRQCLRQLEFLQNVWQSILPESMYNKTLCDVLNEFSTDLIRRIISMEDISTTVADELSGIITMILNKGPELFKDKHQVIQIKTWTKLEQLKMILNASLLEITDQWCEGSGILTANYKAEEIKHLIRALFQNTDRRANALSSIV